MNADAHRRQLGVRIGVLALAVVACGLAIVTSRTLFPLYSLNHDDAAYVAVAEMLRDGKLVLDAHDHEFFRPWASGVRGDRIVPKYSPPWPGVIALAGAVGARRLALGVTAAAAVVLVHVLATQVLGDRRTGLAAAGLMALSPVVVLQSGTYLPYLFQLVAGLAFAVLVLAGLARGSPRWLVGGGAALGVAAFARPFDAILFATPFVVLVALGVGTRSTPVSARLGRLASLGVGAAPVLAVALAHNAATMGSPFTPPFRVTGPQDSLGFGRKGVFPSSTIRFTFADGVEGITANLSSLPRWAFGGVVLVALAGLGWHASRGVASSAIRGARWAVAALGLVFPLGYVGFWGPYAMSRRWPGLAALGPFYLLPVLVPLAVFGAHGLLAVWRRGGLGPTAVVAVAMAALTAAALPDPLARNRAVTEQFRATKRYVDRLALPPAVVFLPRRGDLGFAGQAPFLENRPDLDQPVLYAEDRHGENFELVDRYPARRFFRLSFHEGGDGGGPPRPTLDALRVEEGTRLEVRLALGRPVATAFAYISDHGPDWEAWRTEPLGPAPAEVVWTVLPPAPRPHAGSPAGRTYRLSDRGPAGVLTVGVAVPGAGRSAMQRWERRIPFRVLDGGRTLQLLRPGGERRLGPPPPGRRRGRWVAADVDSVVAERR